MANKKRFKEYKLDNGLLVALERTPTRTIVGQLSIYHGTVDEKPGEEGMAHFLEHCLFTGGAGEHDEKEVSQLAGSLGEFNAGTTIDETMFRGGFAREDLEIFLGLTSAMTFSPRFNKNKVGEERQRVLREISNKFGDPEYTDWKSFQREVLGEKNPLTRETLGTEESVGRIMLADLKEFHLEGYNPNNMELVLVGALPRNTLQLVKNYFEKYPKGRARGILKFPCIDHLDKRFIRHVSAPDLVVKNGSSQSNAYLQLDIFTPPRTHEDFAKIVVLTAILGEGAESYLYNEISQRSGLSYDISANYSGSHGLGDIKVHGKVLAEKTDEAIDKIFYCFGKLREEKIDENLLLRQKRKIEYGIAKDIETNASRLGAIRGFIEHRMTVESVLERVHKLTAKDLQEAAQKYLPESRDGNYSLLIRDPLKI